MFKNESLKRALNSLITDRLSNFSIMFVVTLIALGSLTIINFTTLFITKLAYPTTSASSSTGILTVGVVTALIALSIAFFASTSNEELRKQFIWPINRDVYAVGNFVVMLISAIIFISGISILLFFEIIPAEVFRLVFTSTILTNYITLQNFLEGYWVSICYVMLAASLSYCIGMYFFRHKIVIAISLLLLSLLTINPVIRSVYAWSVRFITGESAILLFSIKAWLVILAIHALAYIPLKRLEVRL